MFFFYSIVFIFISFVGNKWLVILFCAVISYLHLNKVNFLNFYPFNQKLLFIHSFLILGKGFEIEFSLTNRYCLQFS